MTQSEIIVTNTRPEHAEGVTAIICDAYGVPESDCLHEDQILKPEHIRQHIAQFPDGQFVALDGNTPVGMAATMLTNRQPEDEKLGWLDQIGGLAAKKHVPDGGWLYGVEFTVRKAYRKRGIGSKLYAVRFAMCQRLNLKGFYAGGMLMGYYRYRDQMTPLEYGEKVKNGEISDPTVTMQMNRGFEPVKVILNYLVEEPAGNAAMLIVWRNPDYTPK